MSGARGRRTSATDDRRPSRGDADLDQLFTAVPEQLVAARKELVAKLAASGRRDAASKIKGLPRPTLAVWTINQLARLEPERVATLLESGDRLRDAQGHALRARQSQVGDLRAAAHAERQALGALVRAAGRILGSAGRAESSALLGRIESTLHAIAAGGGAEREALREGHLSHEVQMVGFPSVTERSSTLSSRSPPKGKTSEPSAAKRELETARAEDRSARSAAKGLAKSVRQAERNAERLRLRAERAQGAAIKASAEAQAAEQIAAAARQKLSETEQRIQRASARLAAAQGKL